MGTPLQATTQRERKVYVRSTTRLCEINHHLTTSVYDFLAENGYDLVTEPEQATDLLVVTCGALQTSEDRSIQQLQKLVQSNPSSKLYVLGCLPMILPELPLLENAEVIGPKDLHRLNERFEGEVAYDYVGKRRIDHELVQADDLEPNRFTLLIGQGCVGSCTYCAIKKAKGVIKSESEVTIVAAFRAICAEHDNPTIALLGEDFGSWGLDQGTDAVQLLRTLTNLDGRFSIEIQNFEPSRFLSLYERIRPIIMRGRVTKVHVAVQSGSQRILRVMNRRYDVNALMAALRDLSKAAPQLVLETSFIVNFPTEEREDFVATLRLIPEFDEVVVFSYSPRAGTEAAEMADTIAPAERDLRESWIRELQEVHPRLCFM